MRLRFRTHNQKYFLLLLAVAALTVASCALLWMRVQSPYQYLIPPLEETRQQCVTRLFEEADKLDPQYKPFDWGNWTKGANLSDNPLKATFTKVYERHVWRNSGPGSRLESTVRLRCYLKNMLRNRNITIIIDAPCGDMWWMSRFLDEEKHIKYVGIDIVPAVINRNRALFANKGWEFFQQDLTEKDALIKIREKSKVWPLENPEYALVISRHAIQHNNFAAGKKIFTNIANSYADYFIQSIDIGIRKNEEPDPGGFINAMNFMVEPFGFYPPLELVSEFGSYFMGLWHVGQMAPWLHFDKESELWNEVATVTTTATATAKTTATTTETAATTATVTATTTAKTTTATTIPATTTVINLSSDS